MSRTNTGQMPWTPGVLEAISEDPDSPTDMEKERGGSVTPNNCTSTQGRSFARRRTPGPRSSRFTGFRPRRSDTPPPSFQSAANSSPGDTSIPTSTRTSGGHASDITSEAASDCKDPYNRGSHQDPDLVATHPKVSWGSTLLSCIPSRQDVMEWVSYGAGSFTEPDMEEVEDSVPVSRCECLIDPVFTTRGSASLNSYRLLSRCQCFATWKITGRTVTEP